MYSINFYFFLIITVMAINMNSVFSQRSPYAGSRPNGYHDRLQPQTSSTTEAAVVNRFGDDNSASQRPPVQGVPVVQALPNFAPILPVTTSTLSPELSNRINTDGTTNNNNNNNNNNNGTPNRLPYDAYNDQYLVDNYNRGPIDNRPFWLINAEHIERQRNLTNNQVANFNPVAAQSSFLGTQG